MKSTRKNLIGFGMRKIDGRNASKKNGKNNAEWNIGDWSVNGRNTGRLSMNKNNKRMSGDRKTRGSFLK